MQGHLNQRKASIVECCMWRVQSPSLSDCNSTRLRFRPGGRFSQSELACCEISRSFACFSNFFCFLLSSNTATPATPHFYHIHHNGFLRRRRREGSFVRRIIHFIDLLKHVDTLSWWSRSCSLFKTRCAQCHSELHSFDMLSWFILTLAVCSQLSSPEAVRCVPISI